MPPKPQPPPVSIVPWPNTAPIPLSLQTSIPSYLYVEYADDDDLQASRKAYNQYTQLYVTWLNTINLPVYTGAPISAVLLDLVAGGLYGMTRPVLPAGTNRDIGALNTYALNSLPLDTGKVIGPQTVYVTTDDIFKRILTWHLYKGDGKVFTTRWLKRRIMRFLYGEGGTDYIIDQTYPVSVTYANRQININFTNGERTILGGAVPNQFALNTMTPNQFNSVFTPISTPALAPIFAAAVNAGVLELPFQFTYVVNV